MTERSRRLARRLFPVALGLVALSACSGPENGQNSLKPAGPSAEQIDNLFFPIVVIAFVVGILITVATLYVAIRYRRRSEDEMPKQTHGNTKLEITWTIIPAMILAVIAVPTVATIFDLAAPPKGDVLTIKVVAKQWWWQFDYPDQKFVTANELHIPVGEEVELDLTACDPSLGTAAASCNVIHSFWVPELAGKQDIIPGRKQRLKIEADEAGTYLGQCAEYCGLSHANMRFRVIAQSREDFDAWIKDQQAGPAVPFTEDTVVDGKETSEPAGKVQELVSKSWGSGGYGCVNCHTFSDSSLSTFGPNLTHLASRTTFASGSYELNRQNLVDWILDAPGLVPMESQDCLLPPPATCVGMPSFTQDLPPGPGPMPKSDAETIADYLLSLK